MFLPENDIDPDFLIWKKISYIFNFFSRKTESIDSKPSQHCRIPQNKRSFWSFGEKDLSKLPKIAHAKIEFEPPKCVLMWKKHLNFHIFCGFIKYQAFLCLEPTKIASIRLYNRPYPQILMVPAVLKISSLTCDDFRPQK